MDNIYVGRQPILNKHSETVAYELLFRSSTENAFDTKVDGTAATAQVIINSMLEMGLQDSCGERLLFINLTSQFIEQPTLLDGISPDQVVLEVLESVTSSPEVLDGLSRLKKDGFRIALDDFVLSDDCRELLPFADIIKYDITDYSQAQLSELAGNRSGSSPLLLAERVETQEEFEFLSAEGFDLFQGYFFAKPRVLDGKRIPANRLVLLDLMAKVYDTESTINDVADVLAQDVALSVRALKFVNSPVSGLQREVTSIQQAAVLLGIETIRSWATLLLLAQLDDKPRELMRVALTRARFCQLMAKRNRRNDDDLCFTVGLLSLLDAVMDLSMPDVLNQIAASNEVQSAIIDREGFAGEMLSITQQIERCSSNQSMNDYSSVQGITPTYFEAVDWAETRVTDIAA